MSTTQRIAQLERDISAERFTVTEEVSGARARA